MSRKKWMTVAFALTLCMVMVGLLYVRPNRHGSDSFPVFLDVSSQPPSSNGYEDKPSVVNHLKNILGDDISTAQRIQLVSSVPDDLSEIEQQSIINFITGFPNTPGEYVVKNNLMNRLVSQVTPLWNMSDVFIGIASDRHQDIVIRAYAVQHLRPLYERSRDATIRDYLYNALFDDDTEVSGGAMLALNYLLSQDEYCSEFEREPLVQQARKVVFDSSANNNNRITAIQIATSYNNDPDPELADALRLIIRDENRHSALRISAIAGLGSIGDETDLGLLKNIAQSGKYEERAADAAIRTVLIRHGGAP